MKNKSLFWFAHKSNQKISKKIIFILIIIVLFLLIFIPFTFYKTYKSAVNNMLYTDFSLRIINIEEGYDIANLNLETNKHVIKILNNFSYYYKEGYQDKNNEKRLTFIPAYSNFIPKITSGKNIENDNEIICPSKLSFGVFDEENINNLIDMQEQLNKTLNFTFYKLIYHEDTDKTEEIPYTYSFKLVGLYDAGDTYTYDTCYLTEKSHSHIINETKPYNDQEYAKTTAIFVDKYENVKEITDILDKNSIKYQISTLDTEFLTILLKSSIILIILFICFSIIILNIYLNIILLEKRRNFALLKALGFQEKDIRKILLSCIFELLLQSLFYALLITMITKYSILYLVRNNVTFMTLNIKISYIPVIIYIIVIMLSFSIIIFNKTKKLYSLTVKENIEK